MGWAWWSAVEWIMGERGVRVGWAWWSAVEWIMGERGVIIDGDGPGGVQ